ncbi:MAG: hypothetical protein ACI4T9_03785, partial [Prevotella sp.]
MEANDLNTGLEEGEHGYIPTLITPATTASPNHSQTLFALFEAGCQRNHSGPKPHAAATPCMGLTVWHLSEVLIGANHLIKNIKLTSMRKLLFFILSLMATTFAS